MRKKIKTRDKRTLQFLLQRAYEKWADKNKKFHEELIRAADKVVLHGYTAKVNYKKRTVELLGESKKKSKSNHT